MRWIIVWPRVEPHNKYARLWPCEEGVNGMNELWGGGVGGWKSTLVPWSELGVMTTKAREIERNRQCAGQDWGWIVEFQQTIKITTHQWVKREREPSPTPQIKSIKQVNDCIISCLLLAGQMKSQDVNQTLICGLCSGFQEKRRISKQKILSFVGWR